MTDGTGEHPNGRKAMDAVIKRQVEHGVKPDVARANAQKALINLDRNNYGRSNG